MNDDATTLAVHATCVAVNGKGVLIVGASGSGKSTLALQMLAMGAELVADDQVILRLREQGIWASCKSGFAV